MEKEATNPRSFGRKKATLVVFLVIALVIFVISGQPPHAVKSENPATIEELRSLDTKALDQLFRQHPAKELPKGRIWGEGLTANSTTRTAWFVNTLIWKGKSFYPEEKRIANIMTPLGIEMLEGELRLEDGNIDGLQSIIVDYGKPFGREKSAGDEIREVAPGLYLGRGMDGGQPGFWFALQEQPE